MTPRLPASLLGVVAAGLLAFVILAIRFSPNWAEFYREFRSAESQAVDPAQRAAVTQAFGKTICLDRGVYVMKQVTDLRAAIDDSNHKIVRWRLLFPAVGHFLGIPGFGVLGFSLIGCIVFVVTLGLIGANAGLGTTDAFCLAIVGGATAPFFTSMGWLGYFDAWFALALLIVAFVRPRPVVWLACLLGPWVDERIALGLPLALGVRWAFFQPDRATWRTWLRREIIPPALLIAAFAVLRIGLGGSGNSQTIRSYWTEFIFARPYYIPRILLGMWEGLRFGWPLLIYLAIEAIRTRRSPASPALQFSAVVVLGILTATAGLASALDMSRSMVLLLPVVPLGWVLASRTDAWKRLHAAPVLAAAAVLLPANHVVSRFVIPVDNLWSTPYGVPEALNNVGTAYAGGKQVPRNDAEAAKWFHRAAQLGSTPALINLGILNLNGQGMPKDPVAGIRFIRAAAEKGDATAQSYLGRAYLTGVGVSEDHKQALEWLHRSAQQGQNEAQKDLGGVYSLGLGVPRNPIEALKWYRRAAAQGNVEAQTELGDIYSLGIGVPKDASAATEWYKGAARRAHPRAQSNLGVMYAKGEGVPRDEIEAMAWFYLAAAGGDSAAAQLIARGEKSLGEENISRARKRSQELLQRSPP